MRARFAEGRSASSASLTVLSKEARRVDAAQCGCHASMLILLHQHNIQRQADDTFMCTWCQEDTKGGVRVSCHEACNIIAIKCLGLDAHRAHQEHCPEHADLSSNWYLLICQQTTGLSVKWTAHRSQYRGKKLQPTGSAAVPLEKEDFDLTRKLPEGT